MNLWAWVVVFALMGLLGMAATGHKSGRFAELAFFASVFSSAWAGVLALLLAMGAL